MANGDRVPLCGNGSVMESCNTSDDSIGRRSRFRRSPVGKHIFFGRRDLEILRCLHSYRYLRQDHLLALLPPKSKKRFVERLGDLFHETGYINRPGIQHRHFDAHSSPILYELSQAGLGYLQMMDAVPHRAVNFSRRVRGVYNPQFLHTMMIIDTLVSVDVATRMETGQRFVPFEEILTKAPAETRNAANPLSVSLTLLPRKGCPQIRGRMDTHLIPDALYGIEYLVDGEKKYRFFALECERTSPASRSAANASSLALKRAAYDTLLETKRYKQHWGIPNLKLDLVVARPSI
ncbi:MAG: replication-relaxation family protein [Rhizobiaceae bacterium]